jgi:hypothetical protein
MTLKPTKDKYKKKLQPSARHRGQLLSDAVYNIKKTEARTNDVVFLHCRRLPTCVHKFIFAFCHFWHFSDLNVIISNNNSTYTTMITYT